jgi:tetratricopeptide (TPR) repeat protein
MDWDELGDALEEIGEVPNLDFRIGEYRRLLAELPPGQDGHAEVLTVLADDLTSAGQLDDGEAAYQQAIDDGGRTVLNPHVGLLDVALARGDDVRAGELLSILLVKSRADELVVGDYEWIGDSLEEAGRLRAALRWFTIPLRDIQPGDLDLMPVIALDGRWRVRRALDLPVDAYDEAHDVWHELNDDQI